MIFVHKGHGTLTPCSARCRFKPFDYVVIPHCTTYRLDFDAGDEPDLLVIEAAGNVDDSRALSQSRRPDSARAPRSASATCTARPKPLVIDREQDTTVLIKDGMPADALHAGQHPFDVVGWDGMVYPYTFNADDFEPITGTIHQPPPIHQTFEAPGFVVCTFAPRLLDTHPEAIKVPYAHSNVQADEVLYYVRGQFGSRRGVEEGVVHLHPRGIPHGPHPGTIVASRSVTRTDELAVMVDTVRPLAVDASRRSRWTTRSIPIAGWTSRGPLAPGPCPVPVRLIADS